eukprot:scaffold69974_cov51-Attheya_sp.AAC.4
MRFAQGGISTFVGQKQGGGKGNGLAIATTGQMNQCHARRNVTTQGSIATSTATGTAWCGGYGAHAVVAVAVAVAVAVV